MSELSKLTGNGKKIKLGELELNIRPLTVSSMPLLIEAGSENTETQSKAMMEIIKRTLKEAVPDATDEEIDRVGLEYIMPLMDVIMELNKMDNMSDAQKAMIEQMKKK